MDVHGGREESKIDYVLVREEERDEVKSMKVGDNTESDHHPLIVRLKGAGGGELKKELRGKNEKLRDMGQRRNRMI